MSWFPVFKQQIEHDEFKKLSPVQKLYYWFLASEFNRRGEFYKDDAWFAAALGLKSINTIERARRKFKKMGFIDFTSGGWTKGQRPYATTYHNIKWARPTGKGEGLQYVEQHRYAFNALLNRIRSGNLTHADVTVYVYLNYVFKLFNGYIRKSDFQKLVYSISQPMNNLKNLYNNFSFANGSLLFEYKDHYHSIEITKWSYFADPAEDENNRKLEEEYYQEIDNRKTELRKEKSKKEIQNAGKRGKLIYPEQLPLVFKAAYEEMYQTTCVLDGNKKDELIELGKKHTPGEIGEALLNYFTAENVPNPTGAKTKTLARFLRVYKQLLPK